MQRWVSSWTILLNPMVFYLVAKSEICTTPTWWGPYQVNNQVCASRPVTDYSDCSCDPQVELQF